MPQKSRKSALKSILEMWHEFMYQRCDDLGAELVEDEGSLKRLNDLQEIRNEIQDKLPPEDKSLVKALEEEEVMWIYRTKYHTYTAGFRDGMKLAQTMLVPENGDTIVLPPID